MNAEPKLGIDGGKVSFHFAFELADAKKKKVADIGNEKNVVFLLRRECDRCRREVKKLFALLAKLSKPEHVATTLNLRSNFGNTRWVHLFQCDALH